MEPWGTPQSKLLWEDKHPFIELFFGKKIPLRRRVGYVMDGWFSRDQWISDVCMSHQSDWFYH